MDPEERASQEPLPLQEPEPLNIEQAQRVPGEALRIDCRLRLPLDHPRHRFVAEPTVAGVPMPLGVLEKRPREIVTATSSRAADERFGYRKQWTLVSH